MPVRRTDEERVRDVRRVIEAGRAVYAERARLRGDIARFTGLSPAGVDLGFESLERDASEEELRSLVARAGDAPRVHVVLSANVFVAPLRALAVARAAAARVTVRPSSRDPVLARAIVDGLAAAGDASVVVEADRDVTSIAEGEIHVYGRAETIAAVRAAATVAVRAHGPGMGIALVTGDLDVAAGAVAADVVPFDQRGCLSPRVVLVVGEPSRAGAFGAALHERLGAWGGRVPRGELTAAERAEATRWVDSVRFAGDCHVGRDHAVGVVAGEGPLGVPPAGRHVLVAGASTLSDAFRRVEPFAPFVVAIGTDDVDRAAPLAPPNARLSQLGRMQRPPLDGPVDLR
jgi:hypothetical protein